MYGRKYDLFEEKSYDDKETGLTLPYELYVPGDYDASKKYPEVLAENKIAVWHAHSRDDDQVLFDDFGQTSIDAMEKAGVEYQTRIFEPG